MSRGEQSTGSLNAKVPFCWHLIKTRLAHASWGTDRESALGKSCKPIAGHIRVPDVDEVHRPVAVLDDVAQGLVQSDAGLAHSEVSHSILNKL